MATETATFPAAAPSSAGVLLPAFTLWWREIVRFYLNARVWWRHRFSTFVLGRHRIQASERRFVPDKPPASSII